MPFDGPAADVEEGGDFGVAEALVYQVCDMRFVGGEFTGGFDGAFPGGFAGGAQFAAGASGEGLGSDAGEDGVGGPQLFACVQAARASWATAMR